MKISTNSRIGIFKYVFIILVVCSFFLYLTTNNDHLRFNFYSNFKFTSNLSNISSLASSWLIDTDGCQILDVTPMHQFIKPYIEKKEPFVCPKNISDGLIYTIERKMFINKTVRNEVLKHYNIIDKKSFKCCVTNVKRFPEEKDSFVVRQIGECQTLKNGTSLSGDLTKVQCFIDEESIYDSFEIAFIRKKDVESRCQSARENLFATHSLCEEQLSVLVIGIDSVSRLNFHRHLSKSYEFLMHQMKGLEVFGYNKVGENTFPSLMPLLSGQSVDELLKGCWGGRDKTFDKCTFLMDLFGSAGYRTAFIEDQIQIGLFNYLIKGFIRQHADYYGHTYFSALNSARHKKCFKSMPHDELVVKLAVDFQKEYKNDPHFGFFWTCIFSHDYLNDAQLMDPILFDGLLQLNNDSLLNNTLLIVMTDHGMRYGDIWKSDLGKYEVDLPLMILVFPEWFKKKYSVVYQNVQQNARSRLVTLFDVHQTLLDILYCEYEKRQVGSHHHGSPMSKKFSLFGKVSPFRTCDDAGIPHEYCACFKRSTNLNISSEVVKNVASRVVSYLNDATSNYRPKCAELKLKSISKAFLELPGLDNNMVDNRVYYYDVYIVTEPGQAEFQSFVKYRCCNEDYKVENAQRISQYGNSSYCVDVKSLKPICYCI